MKKIAVVIGHDKKSPGSFSKIINKSEFTYNTKVASCLTGVDIYNRPAAGNYHAQMKSLRGLLMPHNYDLIVELHFNMFDGISNNKGEGVETITYPGNEKSLAIGKKYCKLISEHYDTVNRGAKEGKKIEANGRSGRGWWFLHYMPAPAIIVEPFFGDENEALKFKDEAEYANIITKWLQV